MKKIKIKSVLLFMLAIATSFIACKKNNDEPTQTLLPAATSIRLVHSSYLSGTVTTDLYIDKVKINTAGGIAFSMVSAYFPTAPGEKKIEVKDATGALLADTVLTIADGEQHSLFIKDRSWKYDAPASIATLKKGLISMVDNRTTAPASGKAKIRFVNMSSQPLNSTAAYLSFYWVNGLGVTTQSNIFTSDLGIDREIFGSEYTMVDSGPITFRASGNNLNIGDLTTSLEAGKLYTLYVVSTSYTVKTPTKSPIELKIISNN